MDFFYLLTSGAELASVICPGVHDGFTCWPLTAAGTYATVPCPPSLLVHNSSNHASRYCGMDGNWEPDTTDYLPCATDNILQKVRSRYRKIQRDGECDQRNRSRDHLFLIRQSHSTMRSAHEETQTTRSDGYIQWSATWICPPPGSPPGGPGVACDILPLA
ncbi:hypothetical protein SK128_015697 [Halocaridina rubra]|uniref:G-protein coupled receptors family 2 profile 1 domain-containing protein n=1 Tax=Halocaridina rubra TaxID=373956 RepID=A0AAN8XDU2_HALRR